MSEVRLLTAGEMRAWERSAIDAGTATGIDLMERAGKGAVAEVLAYWPDLARAPARAHILCGPGNNGGDGFVVARLLLEMGWAVEAYLLGESELLPPDARANHDRWAAKGSVLSIGDAAPRLREESGSRVLVVDAIFGTGLTRDVPQSVSAALTAAADAGLPRVALDVPSMLQSDSGRSLPPWRGDAAPAQLTVAFGAPKRGHYLGDGPRLCGRLVVVGLDLPGPLPPDAVPLAGPPAGLGKGHGHKYDHGHALVVAGGFGRTGAARLAARGALRIGAGLATVAAPGAAMLECATQLTAVMLRRCDDGDDLEKLLSDRRLNTVCLGPGLGTDERARGLIAAALVSGRPAVLDADALTLLAEDPALWKGLHGSVLLTPHMGEFARLCPDQSEKLGSGGNPAYGRVEAAREASAALGCTILLKGPDTILGEPSGRVIVHSASYDREAPWLATAGAGDVLAGMAAGLMARGLPAFDAGRAAAWLHVEAARRFGPGLVAEDLPEILPGVLKALSPAR
jgi:hydroxyethylthiazole kinase-like uncharacterized protein yjeF